MKNIRLFLTDVDGCLTDGGMYYSANGDEMKRFCVYDGMGMVLMRKAGIKCGILTSEDTPIVEHRARKLNLDYLYMGVGRVVDNRTQSKLDVCRKICEEMGIGLDEVCYVGDDVNDMDLLRAVGYPCCPMTAREEVKKIEGIKVVPVAGGQGVIRALADEILGR